MATNSGHQGETNKKLSDESGKDKKPRTRSPNYPAINLKTAIERAKVFYGKQQRHSAGMEVVAGFWGYSAKTSQFAVTLGALRSFGLIEDVPNGGHRLLKLTKRALDIVTDYPEGDPMWMEAVRRAALSPRLHNDLWTRYGYTLPSNEEIRRYLVRERGFNDNSVGAFIDEYKETIAFANFGDGDIIPPADEPAEEEEPMQKTSTNVTNDIRAAQSAPANTVPTALAGSGPYISFPLPGGNLIEIRLRQKLSPSDFATVKKLVELSEASLVEDKGQPN